MHLITKYINFMVLQQVLVIFFKEKCIIYWNHLLPYIHMELICCCWDINTGGPEEISSSSAQSRWDDSRPANQGSLDSSENGFWDHLRPAAPSWKQLHPQVRHQSTLVHQECLQTNISTWSKSVSDFFFVSSEVLCFSLQWSGFKKLSSDLWPHCQDWRLWSIS